MSDTVGVLVAPAAVAVGATLFLRRRTEAPAGFGLLLGTGLAALVIGFFATFTVAWAIDASAVAIWSTAIVVGLVVAAFTHFGEAAAVRGNTHG